MGLADSIIGAESGGNATAKNPRSSATGAGQFIASTWLDTIRKHRPDLAGLPSDQVLALRNDPALSRDMTQAYADDNAAVLRKSGFEPTPGNAYLAHFAGPAGATSVLGADPSTPVSAVLPAASIAANPFLNGMSAGDLTAWAAKKVGDGSATMTMPGSIAGAGAFGLSGPVSAGTAGSVTPAGGAMMQTPPAESGPDFASLLKALGGSDQTTNPAAQPQAKAPAPLALQPHQRRAQPFDAARYLASLARPARA